MSQCISTDWVMTGCISFWVVCLGSVLPSFLPSRFQPCLSLVSWANSQRRARRWAWTTSNADQTLQPEDRQEPWSSARALSLSIIKKTDLERAVLRRWGCQAGGCEPTFSLFFVSVFFCSALSELFCSGGVKMRVSGLMSSGNCILIHLRTVLLAQGN